MKRPIQSSELEEEEEEEEEEVARGGPEQEEKEEGEAEAEATWDGKETEKESKREEESERAEGEGKENEKRGEPERGRKREGDCDLEEWEAEKEIVVFERILDALLRSKLHELMPRNKDDELRRDIIEGLDAVVLDCFLPKGSRIVPFGSFASFLHSRWSDLDLSLEIRNGLETKESKIVYLKKFRRALYNSDKIKNIRLVPQARIPILSFLDVDANISCDISVNNGSGIFNSNLLRMLLDMDERCRKLIYLIKCWAKSKKINDSKLGTMNSYTLSQLAIFHLQTIHPPILPPLQCFFPDDFYARNQAISIENPFYREDVLSICKRKIQFYKLNFIEPENTQPLSSLFTSFFEKYSKEHEFWNKRMSLSTFFGTWQNKSHIENEWNYSMLIEDPCDKANNCARSVRQLKKISDAFEETNGILMYLKKKVQLSPANKIQSWLNHALFEMEDL